MANWRERHRTRDRTERLKRIILPVLLLLAAVSVSMCCFEAVHSAHATWKPEYAQADQAVQDWYKNAELTPEAQKRFGFKGCCDHADVVKTRFQVSKKNGADVWEFWDDAATPPSFQPIPSDIIHWGEAAPGGLPTLFRLGAGGALVCFWPGEGGI